MAKKTTKKFSFGNLVTKLDSISKKTEIILEEAEVKRKTYIDTGIYMLNALLSKNIRTGGVPRSRITVFAGPSGCGKSFLCYNVVKNAQKEGYNVVYIDTEYSIETEELVKFGIDLDPEKFLLLRVGQVEALKMTLTQLLDSMKEEKLKGTEIPKTLFVVDSVGQLASLKETNDAKEGKNKVDMSRAKALKSLFRIINNDLGFLNIPMVCTNHTYLSQDLFPKPIMAGGEGLRYSASTIIMMSIAKLKTGEESTDSKLYVKDLGQSGIIVTAKADKNRMARPMQVKFEINHTKGTNKYKGLEAFCTPENYEKIGICKGKMEKGKFTPVGVKYYVRHLNKTFYEKALYTKEIFTEEVLDKLEPIIEEYFTYNSRDNIVDAFDDDDGSAIDIDDMNDDDMFN